MMEEAKKLVEAANELKEMCFGVMFDSSMLKDMSAEEFKLFQTMFELADTSTKLVLEQAKLFEQMDKKLDKLLLKSE